MKKNILTIFLLISLVIYLLIGNKLGFYIPCPFYKITNLYCPGCGVTRMLLNIIKGNLVQAFRYNPLVFLLLPLFIIYFVLEIKCRKMKKTNLMNTKKFNKMWYLIIIITICFGIMRNISYFSYLAPTKI